MTKKDVIQFGRDDLSLLASLKANGETATKVLDDHTRILTSIDKTLGDLNDAFDKRITEMEARKIDRTEINLLHAESLDERKDMRKDIAVLKDAHKELVITIRTFRWMIGILFLFLTAIAIPLFSIYLSNRSPSTSLAAVSAG